MTRKRCIKLLMANGYCRDEAREKVKKKIRASNKIDEVDHFAKWNCYFVRIDRGCYEKCFEYWSER